MQKEEMTLPIDATLATRFEQVLEAEEDKEELDFVEDEAEGDGESDDAGFVRYNRAFVAKMSLTADDLKVYYNVVKNTLLSYKGVKSRVSWCGDSYNKGRIRLAKINVRGNSLMLYLALDPTRYEGTKYRYRDVGFKKKFEYVPMLVKVRSKRGLRYAVELIADLMAQNGIAQGAVDGVAYAPCRLPLDALMARNLVRPVGCDGEEDIAEDSLGGEAPAKADATIDAPCQDAPVSEEVPDETLAPESSPEETLSPEEVLAPRALVVDAACADSSLSDSEAISRLATETGVRRKGNKKAMLNIDVICRAFTAGETVDLDALLARRLVKSGTGWVKICARGQLDKPLVVKANDFSTVAIKMILLTGGTAVKIRQD